MEKKKDFYQQFNNLTGKNVHLKGIQCGVFKHPRFKGFSQTSIFILEGYDTDTWGCVERWEKFIVAEGWLR